VLADESKVPLRAEVRDKSFRPLSNVRVEARIVGPEGIAASVELNPAPLEEGVYTGEYTAEKPGSYLAEIAVKPAEGAKPETDDLGRDVVMFRREDGVAENFNVAQNRELLEKLAEQTGGRYYTANDMGKLADQIFVFGSWNYHARNQGYLGHARGVPIRSLDTSGGVAAAAKMGSSVKRISALVLLTVAGSKPQPTT